MSLRYGIVASGGGMSCAYSVGVGLALKDLGLTNPNFIICGSGSSGTFAYWTAEQYVPFRNIWENLLPGPRFVSLKRPSKIMDIDYLIDDVFKKQEPLLVDRVRNSKINLLIGVTNYKTGKGRYFSNHDSVDMFELLRASKAIPVAYNRTVDINGQQYVDGDLALPLNEKVKEAYRLGFDKLIVIDNENDSYISRIALTIYSFFVSPYLRSSISKNLKKFPIKPAGSVILIRPSKKLPVNALNNTQASVKETINIGYSDALHNEQLLALSKNVLT